MIQMNGRMSQLGHQRHFKRKPPASALPLIPDILLSRSSRRSREQRTHVRQQVKEFNGQIRHDTDFPTQSLWFLPGMSHLV